MPREPDKNERASIARAAQLIREAGYRDKAAVLDDMLEEGDIQVDPGIGRFDYMETDKDSIFGIEYSRKIRINPNNAKLRKGAPPVPLDRRDPDFLTLASSLLHEADHVLCHGEIDAYGEEVAFCKTLNRRFAEFFTFDPPLTPAEEKALKDRKQLLEKKAARLRESTAKQGVFKKTDLESRLGPGGMGTIGRLGDLPLVPVHEHYPREPSTALEEHMDMVAGKLFDFRDCRGEFPSGSNAEMVRALAELDACAFRRDELNDAGEVLDPDGIPYVYRAPGEYFPDEFDLYSVRPGPGEAPEIVLCELNRL